MILKLLAVLPEDGYAIVREAESIFLLRPPYERASRVALIENDVQDAVMKHGFTAENAEFANYPELIAHLEKEIERSREESGIPLPKEAPLVEALSIAPPEVIRGFLRRTEDELIPKRRWDQAEDILINIGFARPEEEFHKAAWEVLEKLRSAKQRPQTWQPADARFKTQESEECRIISRVIKQSHRILEPA